MGDSNDLYQLRAPVHDHVLIHAEEENIAAGEVGTLMAFAGNSGQTLEGIHQFVLNPVGDGHPRFSEQVTPNLLEIVFGFRREDLALHEPERSLSHASLSAARRARNWSPRYAVTGVELGKSAIDLGVKGLFIFLKPDLAFALYIEIRRRIERFVSYLPIHRFVHSRMVL
jgi:hypothetical protein